MQHDEKAKSGEKPMNNDKLLSSEKPKNGEKPLHTSFIRAMSELSQIGIMIIACIAIAIVAGKLLDNLLGTSPWLLLVFIFLGIGAAFKSIFDFAKKQ